MWSELSLFFQFDLIECICHWTFVLQAIVDELMTELIDEVSCGLCFEVHRASKLGTIFLDETDIELVFSYSNSWQISWIFFCYVFGAGFF
jgi:hypothetical protein